MASLGSFGGREAANDCITLLNYGDNPENRVLAAQTLAMMNNRRMESTPDLLIENEVVPFLKEIWSEDHSSAVKREIIKGLGLAGGQEEIEFLEQISANDRRHRRDIRRAVRRINYREENGEDWAVARLRKMRRISGCGPVP